jgi:hypothetical protein
MKDKPIEMLTKEQVILRALATMRTVGYGGKLALARAAGVPHQNLSDIFRGTRPPSPKFLAALGLRAITLYQVVSEPVTLDKPIFVRNRKTLLTTNVVRTLKTPRVVHRMHDEG